MAAPFGEIVYSPGVSGVELSGAVVGFVFGGYRDCVELSPLSLVFEVSPIDGNALVDETGAILTDESGDTITW